MIKAYIHYGKGMEPRQTVEVEVKQTISPPNRSISGYSSRIPTSYMIKVNNRWRRVYAIQWSNVGTMYIGHLSGESNIVSINED